MQDKILPFYAFKLTYSKFSISWGTLYSIDMIACKLICSMIDAVMLFYFIVNQTIISSLSLYKCQARCALKSVVLALFRAVFYNLRIDITISF